MRDLAKKMGKGGDNYIKAMYRCMEHCMGTPTHGVTLQPQGKWDGTKDYKFVISGRYDSDYAKNPDTRKSVTGTGVSVKGAPIQWRSAAQKHVTPSVNVVEHAAAVMCAQDMMYQKPVRIHGATGRIAYDLGIRQPRGS